MSKNIELLIKIQEIERALKSAENINMCKINHNKGTIRKLI